MTRVLAGCCGLVPFSPSAVFNTVVNWLAKVLATVELSSLVRNRSQLQPFSKLKVNRLGQNIVVVTR